MEIKEGSGSYDLKGNFEFIGKDKNIIKIKAVDALEIAYTLFDWAGMSYTLLDEINEMIEDGDTENIDEKYWEEVDMRYEEKRDEELLKNYVGEEVWKYGYGRE